METNEERAEMLRQQVISKIHWGARRGEVTDWLKEEHGIEGPRAEELIHAAACARGKAIREKAFLWIVVSLLGLVLSGAFFYVRFLSDSAAFRIRTVPATACASIVATASLATFLRNLRLLFSGKTTGAVD